MSQRLTLPFKTLLVTAGYKHPDYYAYHEMIHYGVDCYDPNTHDVLALGDGEVIAAGQDGPTTTGKLSRLGLVTVIIYRDVLCNNGKVCDLVARTITTQKCRSRPGIKSNADRLSRSMATPVRTRPAHTCTLSLTQIPNSQRWPMGYR